MTTTGERQMTSPRRIVVCEKCGKQNRVPASATGVPRCGNSHSPLPWIVDADDDSFADVADQASIPVLERLAREFAGRVKLVKVDIDQAPKLSHRFAVQAVSTLLVMNKGKPVARQVQVRPGEQCTVGGRESPTDRPPGPRLATLGPRCVRVSSAQSGGGRGAVEHLAAPDEAVLVELNLVGQPAHPRLGTDEDEQRTTRHRAALAGLVVLHDVGLEGLLTDELSYLGVQQDFDPRVASEPVDQVARHVRGQGGSTNGERSSGRPGQHPVCPKWITGSR